jgi:hypothetical protein
VSRAFLPRLREAVNVDDLKQRDRIVRKRRKIRANAVLEKNTIEHINRVRGWNLSTDFWDAVVAWCDNEGPMPTECVHCAMNQLEGFVINGACNNPNCPKGAA